MTQDPSQTSEDRPPHGARPAPDATSRRLLDDWDVETWRSPLAGVAVGVLTLPAVAMALVGLLVLAVQGTATWLLVTLAALVTTALGVLGAVVGLRRGHRGVVHRLAVLAVVWGVVVTVAGVVVALSLDADERVGVAVLLVLGGTYTVVVGLGLWGASRLMAAPAGADAHGGSDGAADPSPRTGASPTVGEATTPAAASDDDALADWPEWGGDAAPGSDPAPGSEPARGGDLSRPGPAPLEAAPVRHDVEDVVDADVVEPPTAAPRTARSSAPSPARRSVTSSSPARPRRTAPAGPATERIARQDGDDGPPTQRIPPVAY
ncbi:hypothetical protein [Cellulomonas phragmiteti]|uniref:Uncharacterized protein n=1 Tax=Cellulomonas phragmiteti TaxID=478780 RepID=A0ABQ4DN49_9CELL|nr:hypothetical protein [Cellulomonas phragmiteti]GIG40774.1 hypothetical protein Cph01nite_25360 [Cellulomonas phragmiteti]